MSLAYPSPESESEVYPEQGGLPDEYSESESSQPLFEQALRRRREAVEEFFRSAPPKLEKASDHTSSDSTRPPHEFDMHLREDLILSFVVNAPSLMSDLMAIADEALQSCESLPPLDGFLAPGVRLRRFRKEKHHQVQLERCVGRIYSLTTARWCQLVAGTLAFQLPEWSAGGFDWSLGARDTREAEEKADGSSMAIADGVLRFSVTEDKLKRPSTTRNPDSIAQSITPMAREIVKKFPELTPWEFKNMLVGERAIPAIVNFSGCERFPWQGCDFGETCLYEHDVGIKSCRMGLDAEDPVCPSIKTIRRSRPSNPLPPLPDLEDPRFSDPAPRHILQQAWAQAVKHDATFLVINAGNWEIIGMRDRKAQTLYISDLIHPYNCEYYKLHTGLYIASLLDAQRRTIVLKKRGLPSTWVMKRSQRAVRSREFLSMTLAKEPGRARFVPRVPYRRVSNDPPSISGHICEDNLLRIEIQEDTGEGSVLQGHLNVPKTALDGIPVLVKIAHGALNVGRLRREYAVHCALAAINGVPKTIGLYEHLETEQKTEQKIKTKAKKKTKKQAKKTKTRKPGIILDGVLVIEDKGKTIAEWLADGDGTPFVSRGQVKVFEQVLKEIHAAKCTHRGLTSDALLIRGQKDSLDVMIGDFGGARLHDMLDPQEVLDYDACAREDLRRLWELIPKPGTRKFDTLNANDSDPSRNATEDQTKNPGPSPPKRSKSVPLVGGARL